ncbi:ribosome recycling factor [candidate division WWE3 bacterium CG_4_10_14_0_2_um_filter_41_14]|uniref:Ribosome recycling factor n=1 Tax=candidate division WWE3 bacterium CG_4_10_14_0_2_um_filter_41_14 TaxID=1975072 RepID=A0A2M7TEJ0_UNCKA|nr:MAG: ribosome recycling factor [candidate division WWE3 bacterium CG_4_10_14_0_2_um_filter_41_14]
MIDTMLSDAQKKFESTKSYLTQELAIMRTSQISPALIQDVEVPAYGGTYPLKELGAISLSDVSTLVVQVWDQSVIDGIAKALTEAQLGSPPSVDGTIIRISIPSMSKEQRENMVKVVKQKSEEAKIAVRNIRQEKNKSFDEMEENGKISEDENARAKKDLQQMVDDCTKEIDTLRDTKTDALLL